MKVIFDTSFLVLALNSKADIHSELGRLLGCPYEPVVSQAILAELYSLAGRRGKEGKGARLALLFLKSRNAKVEKSERGRADEWILSAAKKTKATVCTNDIELKNRLKAARLKTIILKKSHLDFV